MTREEAIGFFEKLLLHVDTDAVMGIETTEAIHVAIKALEQPEIIRCEDCAKCQIDDVYHDYWCDGKKVWKDHFCGYADRKEGEADETDGWR